LITDRELVVINCIYELYVFSQDCGQLLTISWTEQALHLSELLNCDWRVITYKLHAPISVI